LYTSVECRLSPVHLAHRSFLENKLPLYWSEEVHAIKDEFIYHMKMSLKILRRGYEELERKSTRKIHR
jgi:hypothetical protein